MVALLSNQSPSDEREGLDLECRLLSQKFQQKQQQKNSQCLKERVLRTEKWRKSKDLNNYLSLDHLAFRTDRSQNKMLNNFTVLIHSSISNISCSLVLFSLIAS